METSFLKDNFCPAKKVSASSKPRIEFIDLAKGVCILMVVVFHAGFAKEVPAINAMRMPLYFILSGLFFKDYGGLKQLACKKFNRILVPFCFFTVLFLIPGIFKYSKNLIISVFLDPIFAPQVVNYPIWFLLCLFLLNIIYYSIQKTFRNWRVRSVVVLIFGGCGYLLDYYGIYIPYFIGTAFSALPFFYFGVLLNKVPILYSTPKDNQYFGVFVVLMTGAVGYCCVFGTPLLLFRSNRYVGNPLMIYIVSVSLVLGLLMICKRIKWLPIISYCGRYSIIVLGLHGLYLEFATVPLRYVTGHVFTDVEILAITLLLCWISIPLFKGLFPSLTAQKDLFSLPLRYSRDADDKSWKIAPDQ